MFFNARSSNSKPMDRDTLPPPVRQRPQASILQDHLEKLMQENAASENPPPEKKAEHQEPEAKAPAASGEQAQKPENRVITATCLRQTTYARHLHAIMEPFVGDCGKHPAFMEIRKTTAPVLRNMHIFLLAHPDLGVLDR